MMKRVLFVCAHRPNRSPSQRFRFEQYLDLLDKNNIHFEISFLISEKYDSKYYSKGYYITKTQVLISSTLIRIYDCIRARKYDFVFIQREAFMLGTSLFERLFRLSKAKIIFDFDDSIWLPDIDGGNKSLAWLKNPRKTSHIIKMAHIVVAGNRFLAEYAKNFNDNIKLIPTTIVTDLYIPYSQKPKSTVCIGWSGSFSTIKHFELVVKVLENIKSKYEEKVVFKLIGGYYSNQNLKIESQEWNYETELADLEQFDIGLMPLPDDEWSKGKCGLKGLQYMALGIPTIMSPVGVNTEIIEDGLNGFLADSEEDWFDKISRLIESPELRKDLGQRGRQTVIDHYSKKSQAENFLNLFN